MSSKTKTTATKKETTSALVPKLRFPEFRDAGGWSRVRLIDTADRSIKWSFTGGPFGSNLKSSDYVTDGIRIIQLQNIGDGEFSDEYRIFTTPGKADELLSSNIYPGDIIISKMGDPVGRACIIPKIHDRYVMCSDGIRLVVSEKENDKYFVYSLINSPQFRTIVEKNATGSTRKRIGLDELKNLPMLLPERAEQQKIAECLSLVDEVIAAQARKLNALKTHKNGLMQQLFPHEGETQPRLRFRQFQGTKEWRADILGGLSQIVRGGSPRPIDDFLTTAADGLNWLKIGDVDKEAKFVTRTAEKVRPEALSKTRVVHPGDLILSNSMSFGRPYILQIKTCIHDGWIAITNIAEKTDRDFLYYSILAPSSQSYFVDNAAGSGVQNLNADLIKGLPICFPTIPEQQRIVACLSSLDALIAAEAQELESLKTHKRGMIQKLFPSPDNQP